MVPTSLIGICGISLSISFVLDSLTCLITTVFDKGNCIILLMPHTCIWHTVNVCRITRHRGYKTFSMLNSTEHEICPAHKC